MSFVNDRKIIWYVIVLILKLEQPVKFILVRRLTYCLLLISGIFIRRCALALMLPLALLSTDTHVVLRS